MTNAMMNTISDMNQSAAMIAEEYDISVYAATEAKIKAAGKPDTKVNDSRWLAALTILTALGVLALKLQFLYSTGVVQWLLQLVQSL